MFVHLALYTEKYGKINWFHYSENYYYTYLLICTNKTNFYGVNVQLQITFYDVWLKMVQVHTKKKKLCRRDLNPELFKYLFNNCTGFMHLWHNIQHVLSQYMSISPFMYLPGVHFSGSAPLGFERAVGSLQLQRERKGHQISQNAPANIPRECAAHVHINTSTWSF